MSLPTDVTVEGGLTVSLLPNTAGDVEVGRFVARAPAAVIADPTQLAHAGKVVGVSLGDGRCATNGEIEFEGWAMTAETPIYLGANGLPTSALPSSGILMSLGLAITSTRLSIALGQAFWLG